ncbi:MAG: hypothetical protein KDD28_15470 [Phaeodactylibacter sp.]|nr:hypothetical protein [Phaeodactylibacter sp.]
MKNYDQIAQVLIKAKEQYGFKPHYKNGFIFSGQCTTSQMEELDKPNSGWELISTTGEYRRQAGFCVNIDTDEFHRFDCSGYGFRVVDGMVVMR